MQSTNSTLESWICDAILSLFKVKYPLEGGRTSRLAVSKRRAKIDSLIWTNERDKTKISIVNLLRQTLSVKQQRALRWQNGHRVEHSPTQCRHWIFCSYDICMGHSKGNCYTDTSTWNDTCCYWRESYRTKVIRGRLPPASVLCCRARFRKIQGGEHKRRELQQKHALHTTA